MAAEETTLSKIIRFKNEDATITEWMPPVIDTSVMDDDFGISEIDIDSDFIDFDFSQKIQSTTSEPDSEYTENRNKGYEDGFNIGQHEAESVYREELNSNLMALKEIVKNFQEPVDNIENSLQKEVAELSILIAENMIMDHIRHSPESVMGLVDEAIKLLPSKQNILNFYFNPEDLAYIKANLDILPLDDYRYKLHEDEALRRGGLVIRTDDVDIDLSIEKRMHNLTKQFFETKKS